MTSKLSFHKLVVETLRRHVAAVLITALVFFIHTVSFFLNVQNIFSSHYTANYAMPESFSGSFTQNIPASDLEYMLEELVELCSPNILNAVLAMMIGAYLAFDFLRHLHSKKETDFYASMPIKRQTWFGVLFTSSVGIFLLLAAITTGLELIIAFGTGYGSSLILQNMLWNLICMIGVFLATWVTTALAMVMTGHSVIAFLGLGVFTCYVPLLLNNLVPVYASKFFDTYVYDEPNTLAYYFSPVTLGYKLMYAWFDWKFEEHWTYFLGIWIFIALIGVITYVLFIKRPSESAGRAMAFEKANSAIRFLLTIPLALYAGWFLNETANFAPTIWLIFGIVIVSVLIHAMMEAIFQFDVRAITGKKKQLIFEILLSLAFVTFFLFDLCKYDEYIPREEQVKTVKISSSFLKNEEIDTHQITENDWLQGEYVDDALAVAKDILDAKKPSESEYYYWENLTFTYTLKSGLEIKRCYSLDISNAPDSLHALYQEKEFKDDYCMLYSVDHDKILSFYVNNGLESKQLKLTEEERDTLIDTFLEEHTKVTLDDYFDSTAAFQLSVDYDDKHTGKGIYQIYPSFTNTIAFLQEKGVRFFDETTDVSLENLHLYGGKFEYTDELYVSDEEKLKALLPYMIPSDFMYHRNREDDYNYGELRFANGEHTSYLSVYVKHSDIKTILNQ